MSFHLPDIAPMRQRLADVEAQLEKPDTFKDKALLSSLSREHQLLSNTIQHHQTITQLQQQLNDLEGLLTSEEDEAMRELMLQEKTDLKCAQCHDQAVRCVCADRGGGYFRAGDAAYTGGVCWLYLW